jgi:carboxypeptidase Taq
MSFLYEQVCTHARKTALLESTTSLLNWDERTLLPLAAGEYRAEQVTYLADLIHQQRTDAAWGEQLAELSESPLMDDPHSDEATTIRELKREYDKETRLPATLVAELARTSVLGQQVWVTAREANDFQQFQPVLEKTLGLKREQAEALGYPEQPYDALLDEFEPEATTSSVERVLDELRQELAPLVAQIADSGRRPRREILRATFPRGAQEAFGRHAAEKIGFDFRRGRLDVTHHPFCSTMGPHDCRITTRYDEQFFPSAFFSILHEAGHGTYEQGLRPAFFGLPTGSYVSLGIHESQSRLWENFVGRSRCAWQYFFPLAQQAYPKSLAGIELDDFYFAINDVCPSLIRVEADEATYNLHIIIRFEIEQALLSGDLPVADLPGAWNERYRQLLGIEPDSDANGVLQDVHWSAGLFGYFPTYTLGNLYAAQLYASAQTDLGTFDERFSQGDFLPLLEWLREHVHRPGKAYRAGQLVERVTGSALSHGPLLEHLRGKYAPLYQLNS